MREGNDCIWMQRLSPEPITCTHKNNYKKGKALCGVKYSQGSKIGHYGDKINVQNPKGNKFEYMQINQT